MSKTVIAVIITSLITIGVASTFLFPVTKNINSILSDDEAKAEENKTENTITEPAPITTQYISTENNQSKDNLNIGVPDTSSKVEVSSHEYLKSDTIKSNYLIDDVPQTKRN